MIDFENIERTKHTASELKKMILTMIEWHINWECPDEDRTGCLATLYGEVQQMETKKY